jgi:carbonic anhydrase
MDWMPWVRPPALDPAPGPATEADAVAQLLAGNRRFLADVAKCACDGQHPHGSHERQAPFGVVLGCSDARVPLELVFDVAPNQLFVVRVAGNVLGDECLGSIEYALHSFQESLRLLVVLGHTGCGAVSAAVDVYLSPKHAVGIAFSRSLRTVVNHILVAVRSAALSLEQAWGADVLEDPHYREALAELTVPLNAAITAYQLRQELKTHESGGPEVAYGVFDIVSARVAGPPDLESVNLSAAPSTPEELVELGVQLARSSAVTRHLHIITGPFPEST